MPGTRASSRPSAAAMAARPSPVPRVAVAPGRWRSIRSPRRRRRLHRSIPTGCSRGRWSRRPAVPSSARIRSPSRSLRSSRCRTSRRSSVRTRPTTAPVVRRTTRRERLDLVLRACVENPGGVGDLPGQARRGDPRPRPRATAAAPAEPARRALPRGSGGGPVGWAPQRQRTSARAWRRLAVAGAARVRGVWRVVD